MEPHYDAIAELARANFGMPFGQMLRGDARTAEAEMRKVMSRRSTNGKRRQKQVRKSAYDASRVAWHGYPIAARRSCDRQWDTHRGADGNGRVTEHHAIGAM